MNNSPNGRELVVTQQRQRERARVRRLFRRQRNGCWLWQGARNWRGYGAARQRRPDGTWTVNAAHRVVWEALVGPCPRTADGLVLEFHHTCGVRACVNPAHGQWVLPRQHNNARWRR